MPVFAQSLVARLARKELREILRDRRTIITLVLMPVLLYPILGIAFQHFVLTVAPPVPAQNRIGVAGEEERARLEDLLNYEDPKFTFFEAPLPDAHILSDEIELGLRRLDSPPGIERWEVVARSDSPTSRRALRLLQQRLAARNIERLQYRLRS